METHDIIEGIKNGSLFYYNKKIYTKDEYNAILEAKHQVEHYDLLQLTKKIQL